MNGWREESRVGYAAPVRVLGVCSLARSASKLRVGELGVKNNHLPSFLPTLVI